IDPRTGKLLAMTGSLDMAYGFGFNRAIQPQQPGSTAKIFTYTYGIRRGFLPNTLFCDRPLTILMPAGSKTWNPSNYGDKYRGWLTMSDALRQSLNGVAIMTALGDVTDADTLNAVGNAGPDSIVVLSRLFGIKSLWKPYPSVAIGAFEATLLEMAYAYAALANGGMYHPPKLIQKINGQEVPDDSTRSHRAISEQEAYIVTSMFRNPLRPGGTGAGFFGRVGFQFPAAGKTGTTNDSRDCWFVVFTPEIVVAVWVGYDDNRPLRNGTGSSAAMPIAAEFIKRVAGQLQFPDWTMPSGVELKKFNSTTGRIKSPDEPPEETDLEAVFPIAASENKN
ncbi:hypothetical protein GYA13_04210, partial [Candidatus Kuenenbacteria bacterium]|nr:hypothetical protein [Candidatus Kuenenbacteria bacterium]